MNWPAVINSLREESSRDASRARDAITIHGDKTGAMLLSFASIMGNRLALALEAGVVTEDMSKGDVEKLFNDAKLPKKRSTGHQEKAVEPWPEAV
jgi:hypothetical protein